MRLAVVANRSFIVLHHYTIYYIIYLLLVVCRRAFDLGSLLEVTFTASTYNPQFLNPYPYANATHGY